MVTVTPKTSGVELAPISDGGGAVILWYRVKGEIKLASIVCGGAQMICRRRVTNSKVRSGPTGDSLPNC